MWMSLPRSSASAWWKNAWVQSELKCMRPRRFKAVTGIPMDTASVARMRHTETQTRKSSYERWENVDGIFSLRRADAFARKHVLIIDDVLTTGATTTACADALKEVEGVRISVLTLAVAAS